MASMTVEGIGAVGGVILLDEERETISPAEILAGALDF
jgi:hypothetical protein